MTVPVAAFLQQNDTFGEPLAGGKVFTYAAGTLTPLASYTDQTGAVPNTNPVILDSAGRAQIWLTANVPYKLVLQDAAGVEQETTDNFYAGASPEQLSIAGIVPSTGGTYTGPVVFNGGVTFGDTEAEDLATLDSLGVAPAQNRNLWINSDCMVAQNPLGTVADAFYGLDMVINLAQTASTSLSQLTAPTDGIPYALRITQSNATPQRVGCAQIVETKNCLAYRGRQIVFVPKVRCSVATSIRAAIVAWTGTADAPTRDVVNNWTSTNYTASNFFIANTTTIATGAVAVAANAWTDIPVSSVTPGGVVVPSGMNNLYLVLWSDSTLAQNVTLDSSIFRAGLGTSTPLWTPPDASQQVSQCQRYFQKSYADLTVVGTGTATGRYFFAGNAGSAIVGTVWLRNTMRIPPSVSLWDNNGVAGATISVSAGGVATSRAAAAANITTNSFEVQASVSTDVQISGQWMADARL